MIWGTMYARRISLSVSYSTKAYPREAPVTERKSIKQVTQGRSHYSDGIKMKTNFINYALVKHSCMSASFGQFSTYIF